jgi:cysteine-rich repeat protein
MCDSVTGCETELLDNCCGNGVPEAGEGCDDGNDVLGDGCDAACLIEPPKTVTVDTFNFNGLSQYPLHLDMCSPGQGACCPGTTTKNQMDAFCTLAGYPKGNAVSWVVEWLVTPACYCWGKCTGFAWLSFCCSDVDDRNVVTSVECEE